jgi:hypothetical protein
MSSPCIVRCKTIIPTIPMCYAKCHNANKISLKLVTYVDECYILASIGCDKLKPLGI